MVLIVYNIFLDKKDTHQQTFVSPHHSFPYHSSLLLNLQWPPSLRVSQSPITPTYMRRLFKLGNPHFINVYLYIKIHSFMHGGR